eukprot:UN03457
MFLVAFGLNKHLKTLSKRMSFVELVCLEFNMLLSV